jgi:hypothetical protein
MGAELAKFLLLPGFGSSGAFGFSERSGVVHTVRTPNEPCASCASGSADVTIHNIVFPEYTHSDHFVGVGHTESWLPYLWGIDPGEFSDFVDMCVLAADLEDEKDWVHLEIVESELRERPWKWAGMPLEEFVRRLFEKVTGAESRDHYLDSFVNRAVRVLWHAVRMAQLEQRKAAKNAAIAKRLHPRVATCVAVSLIVEVEN